MDIMEIMSALISQVLRRTSKGLEEADYSSLLAAIYRESDYSNYIKVLEHTFKRQREETAMFCNQIIGLQKFEEKNGCLEKQIRKLNLEIIDLNEENEKLRYAKTIEIREIVEKTMDMPK